MSEEPYLTYRELLDESKRLCDELSEEKNYDLPAWCPATIARKASRLIDAAITHDKQPSTQTHE